MITFIGLLSVPVLVAVGAFVLLDGISWKEFLLQLGAACIVAGTCSAIASCANTSDVEIWNGRVTSKSSEHVSCSHSYQCNCRERCSGSGKDRSCSTVCDTCYEHAYDVDWTVRLSTGDSIDIDRVDSQGILEPPRHAAAKVGEPAAAAHHYANYVKASPDSLFRHQGIAERYAAKIPPYPGKVFDYYRVNRVVTVGYELSDKAAWERDLSELNADLGSKKQVNVALVVTAGLPTEFFYGLEQAWVGGKKNDLIVVIGSKDAGTIDWVDVMAWATDPIVKVRLRDDLLSVGVLEREKVVAAIRDDVARYYQRKPMADFKYLTASITPTTTEWIVSMLIELVIAVGLVWVCKTNDVFGDEGGRRCR